MIVIKLCALVTAGDPRTILRRNSTNLAGAISNNLVRVARALLAKELITQQAHDEALLMGIVDYTKASKLVTALQTLLEASLDQRQYQCLIDICQVLKNLQDQTLESIANDMLQQLGANNTQQGIVTTVTTVIILYM